MSRYPYTTTPIEAAPLGLIVLQTDETIEQDMHRLLKEKSPYISRVESDLNVSPESLQAMESHISGAAKLLPAAHAYGAIGYGCTSGTAQIGVTRIAELVKDGADTDQVSQPVSALVAACAQLKICRLAVLSPYVVDVSDRLRDCLRAEGIETPVFGSFEESEEAMVVRIDGSSIINAARDLCQDAVVDALFLSCTNLRTLDVIAPLEAELDMPVLSSNLVLAWHLAQLGNVPVTGPGRLIATT